MLFSSCYYYRVFVQERNCMTQLPLACLPIMPPSSAKKSSLAYQLLLSIDSHMFSWFVFYNFLLIIHYHFWNKIFVVCGKITLLILIFFSFPPLSINHLDIFHFLTFTFSSKLQMWSGYYMLLEPNCIKTQSLEVTEVDELFTATYILCMQCTVIFQW